ncbi:MAG TPA: class I SAM-dependent methyltransferase [Pyrinomonadaceae bacterium]|nr:class I SAM-dependent methyltransferase [Pyrinomonadaceae bacterium]
MKESTGGAFEAMDRMYRLQRHCYDLTRKYYLLGRDRTLLEVTKRRPRSVVEIGCGTARNLRILAKHLPEARLFGVDASGVMLEKAEKKFKSSAKTRARLAVALAEDWDYQHTFKSEKPFDLCLFSYSLSMIPDWRKAIDNAFTNLDKNGAIIIVDFWDQAELPKYFGKLLKWWLKKFGVEFRPELLQYLEDLKNSDKCDLELISVFRRYAFIAIVKPRGSR